MSDKLKEFISKNEAEFDQLPKSGHFERFKALQDKANPVPKKSQKMVWMRVAAILISVLGISYLFFNLGKMQAKDELVASTGSIIENSELLEAEIFFSEKVDTKKQEVLAFSKNSDPATQHIMAELDKLELQYIDLKEELSINSDNPQIINAMVENYRVRLSLLERLLEQLKKSNTLKQKHHVKVQA